VDISGRSTGTSWVAETLLICTTSVTTASPGVLEL